jgi:hypothetical protein
MFFYLLGGVNNLQLVEHWNDENEQLNYNQFQLIGHAGKEKYLCRSENKGRKGIKCMNFLFGI